MPIRHLINDDGQPFKETELGTIAESLDNMSDNERIQFRNENCKTIAEYPMEKILIVSGPGTGKSTLFKQRINYWLQNNPLAKILALSFVRKLVADLENDIMTDRTLTKDQKDQINVFTLHKYARSMVERNHGTDDLRFQPHFKIISEVWKDVVWKDTLLLSGITNHKAFPLKEYEKQLHDADFGTSADWKELRTSYMTLSKFYNAAGFADLIIYATEALVKNPNLNEQDYFIFDEYQDFNTAEELLITRLSKNAKGLLVVGDDDQVLYEELKSGKASLIRGLYQGKDFGNAMLPFCSRSTSHIAKTAAHFISQNPEADSIKKIYLPISQDRAHAKVQMVGCATSATAVGYIKQFIEEHRSEIETRATELADGSSKDPYLLILTPAKELKFYSNKNANTKLLELVAEFQKETKKFSEDYFKILTYYSLANYPYNNFIFRKVLFYEGVADEVVIELVKTCLSSDINICDLKENIINKALEVSKKIKNIIESADNIDTKIKNIEQEIQLLDNDRLKNDLAKRAINETEIQEIEHLNEEQAELDELEIQSMSSIELMTIVGSKGLSADHVIIIGFDDVNMRRVTKNAFYVAMTRARKSLHIITALGSGGSTKPHDFISHLPIKHIEFLKYTKIRNQKTAIGSMSEYYSYFEKITVARRTHRS